MTTATKRAPEAILAEVNSSLERHHTMFRAELVLELRDALVDALAAAEAVRPLTKDNYEPPAPTEPLVRHLSEDEAAAYDAARAAPPPPKPGDTLINFREGEMPPGGAVGSVMDEIEQSDMFKGAELLDEPAPISAPPHGEPVKQTDLFGNEIDEFKNAKERYGVWPITVWEVDHQDQMTRHVMDLIGDAGGTRADAATARNYVGSANDISIFSPAVASWLLNCYAPKEGICFDPFAGGGTRAIMADKHGLIYMGYEIRADQAKETEERANAAGAKPVIIVGDSRDCKEMETASAHFLITCPPYWNLEKYGGGPGDLSELPTYREFLNEINKVVLETHRILIPGSISTWVVGLHRDKDGGLLPLNHDIANLHRIAGFVFKEEIILMQKNNGAITRVGNFEKGRNHLIRTHEYALVFKR
jgi:DNA modification methylase